MSPATRRTLEGSMRHRSPVTRDARPRQLPTVPSHAVPTRECQSDPPSLPRAIRCCRPRGQPPKPGPPLDISLHVRTRGRYTNVYLDGIEPVESEGGGTDAQEAAWRTAVEAAPWLVGEPGEAVAPDEL